VRAFSRRKGGYTTRFSSSEALLLQTLALQLTELLEPLAEEGDAPLPGLVIGGSDEAPDDAALARLLPDAYRGDDESAREYRRMTERGLAGRKVAHAEVVMATAGTGGDVRLSEADAQAWLRTLTDLRLVLAERLGISDEGWEPSDDDEQRTLAEVYDWLGWMQESLIHAVAS
jgi:hypothetical protein